MAFHRHEHEFLESLALGVLPYFSHHLHPHPDDVGMLLAWILQEIPCLFPRLLVVANKSLLNHLVHVVV
jgi:hypothetical protein